MTYPKSNVTRALVFGIVVLSATFAPAQIAGHWDQQSANAMAMLQKNAERQGNDFYVQFTLLSSAAQSQQQGGFAPAINPGAAERPPTQGLVRIVTGGPESTPGYVSVRVYQYSLYQQGKGWSPLKRLLIHLWEWTAPPNGGPGLISKTDAVYGTSDARYAIASLITIDHRGRNEDPYRAYHAYQAHFLDGPRAGNPV